MTKIPETWKPLLGSPGALMLNEAEMLGVLEAHGVRRGREWARKARAAGNGPPFSKSRSGNIGYPHHTDPEESELIGWLRTEWSRPVQSTAALPGAFVRGTPDYQPRRSRRAG